MQISSASFTLNKQITPQTSIQTIPHLIKANSGNMVLNKKQINSEKIWIAQQYSLFS